MKLPKTVSDIMSPEVATVERNDKLSVADSIMQLGRIRHLIVLDDDQRVAGIVTQRDLLHGALAQALGFGTAAAHRVMSTIYIKEAMSSDVISTTPDTPLNDAAKLMIDHKLGCLPVVVEDRLVGIITETDFVSVFK